MRYKVGIPEALFCFRYFPAWKVFFEELGAEVVVSEPTNKKILDAGVKICVDEACLPVKLFHGHAENLRDKVDFLFVPRFTSVSRNEYICPKFGGLPDMVRHSVKGLPPVISTEINLRKSGKNLRRAALETGSHFTWSRRRILYAMEKALQAQHRYEEGQIRFKARDSLCDPPDSSRKSKAGLQVALIGHPYLLGDSYASMNLCGKLEKMGIDFITPEMVDETLINRYSAFLSKPVFWNYARKAIGTAFFAAEGCKVDAVLYVMSFGCGIDSFICDLIERRLRRSTNIPFMTLTIDEHSGEAGLNTRLEAFLDMILWRKAHEDNISASGECLYSGKDII